MGRDTAGGALGGHGGGAAREPQWLTARTLGQAVLEMSAHIGVSLGILEPRPEMVRDRGEPPAMV